MKLYTMNEIARTLATDRKTVFHIMKDLGLKPAATAGEMKLFTLSDLKSIKNRLKG